MTRHLLDWLYRAGGALAALLIAGICLLVCAQVTMNVLTRFIGTSINLTIPSYADFAGYFLAGASFLSLAYTLIHNGHIRVTLVADRLPRPLRRWLERLALAVSGCTAAFATWHLAVLTHEAWVFGDLSPGIVPIPLWIPQSTVVLGTALLSIALFDYLIRSIRDNASPFCANKIQEDAGHA